MCVWVRADSTTAHDPLTTRNVARWAYRSWLAEKHPSLVASSADLVVLLVAMRRVASHVQCVLVLFAGLIAS